MEEQTLNDPVADLAPHALQREAARLAQEAFALAFRQTLEGKGEERPQIIAQIVQRLMGWANDKREGEAGKPGCGNMLPRENCLKIRSLTAITLDGPCATHHNAPSIRNCSHMESVS